MAAPLSLSRLARAARAAAGLIEDAVALRTAPPVVSAVRADGLSYLSPRALADLHARVVEAEERGVPGLLVEAGCALGGSAIVMAQARSSARELRVYDVFGQIPPPSARDGADVHARYAEIEAGRARGIGGGRYYGYEADLKARVAAAFARHGAPPETSRVTLVEGLFEDTLHPDGPVAVAHIDGDWYDSVWTCLERIEPHLPVGGVLVVDDYHAWSGCRDAVDAYFAERRDRYRFERRARLHVVRER